MMGIQKYWKQGLASDQQNSFPKNGEYKIQHLTLQRFVSKNEEFLAESKNTD